MERLFQNILNGYLSLPNKVDNSSILYKELVKELPKEIFTNLGQRREFLVKGSMGQGNKTDYPWISILNKNITHSTQNGIYVCYLFKRNMEGFYLVLMQGITYFEKEYGRNKYKVAELVSNYIKSEIDDNVFSKETIDLNSKKSSLGYGYEKTTIISKYYESNNFNENELLIDLKEMVKIYDFIINHFKTNNYDEIIENILEYERLINGKGLLVDIDKAEKIIKDNIDEDGTTPYDLNRTLNEVQPKVDRSQKFERITTPIPRKIDYLKKAKEDAKTGLIGEQLVLDYEKERLSNNEILSEYVDKIEWISTKSDYYGYDIKSYDIIDGEVKEIHIEVKTTKSKVDTKFQVSKGEIEASKKDKEIYFVYRLYNINSMNVSFYRVNGEIEDNFELDPITFLASYKGNVSQNTTNN